MENSYKTTGISMPTEILNEIDVVADGWYTSRSKALVRIYQEWKRARETQAKEIEAQADVTEAV